jgi:hypothetical protein
MKSMPGLPPSPKEVVMSSDDSIVQNPNRHFPTLGSLWTAYGVIRLILALCLIIYGRTATLMFGAVLSRVPDPFALMSIFHFLYTVMIVWSVLCALIGFVAGLALLGGQQSGPKLALIGAVVSAADIPFGITLGIYTLVELLPIKIGPLYGRSGHAG